MAIGDRLLLSSPAACTELARMGMGPADAIAVPLVSTLGLALGLPMHCIAALWEDVLARGGTALSVAAQALLDKAAGELQVAEPEPGQEPGPGPSHGGDGVAGALRRALGVDGTNTGPGRAADPRDGGAAVARRVADGHVALFAMHLPGERRRLGPALAKSEAWRRVRAVSGLRRAHVPSPVIRVDSVGIPGAGTGGVGDASAESGAAAATSMRSAHHSEPYLVPPLLRDGGTDEALRLGGSSSREGGRAAGSPPDWIGFDADHTLIRYSTPGMPLRMFQAACRGIREGKVPPVSPRLHVLLGDEGWSRLPTFRGWTTSRLSAAAAPSFAHCKSGGAASSDVAVSLAGLESAPRAPTVAVAASASPVSA